MAVIKVRDIAHVRLRSPDLDAQEEFLTEFGMVRAARTDTALYMRGTDPAHHIHVTEKGEPGFVGFAYRATSEDDLKTVAKLPVLRWLLRCTQIAVNGRFILHKIGHHALLHGMTFVDDDVLRRQFTRHDEILLDQQNGRRR